MRPFTIFKLGLLCSFCCSVCAFQATPTLKNPSRQASSVLAANLLENKKTLSSSPVIRARRPGWESGLRYRSDDWLKNFLSLPHSFVLKRIRFHLYTNVALSVVVAALHSVTKGLAMPLTGHSLLGGFLSLLLVFRTNTAVRFSLLIIRSTCSEQFFSYSTLFSTVFSILRSPWSLDFDENNVSEPCHVDCNLHALAKKCGEASIPARRLPQSIETHVLEWFCETTRRSQRAVAENKSY